MLDPLTAESAQLPASMPPEAPHAAPVVDVEPEPIAPPRLKLGEILVERGKLDPVALERTLRLQQGNAAGSIPGKRERLGELLVTLGLVAQREVTDALAFQLQLPIIESAAYPEFPILEERI